MTAAAQRILALNSLDARYGSTYRFRALAELLRSAGFPVTVLEGEGPAVTRLARALVAACGSYDVLFTQKFNPVTMAAMLVARLRGCPVLVDWDDLDPGLQGSRARRWLATLCELVGPRLASSITTHSEPIRTRARAAGRPTHLVPQGFDDALFRPDPAGRAAARARLGLASTDVAVGHLCTFTHGGLLDLPVILDAWQRLATPEIRFVLIGGGPLEPQVHAALRARGLSGRTRVTGLLPHDEVPAALRSLDVGVVYMSESAANRARISFKVIEYLALDVPVVGQVVGETARLFGHLVVAADAACLPTDIRRVARAPRGPATAAAGAPWAWRRARPALRAALGSLPDGTP